jgi:hypothetical protein
MKVRHTVPETPWRFYEVVRRDFENILKNKSVLLPFYRFCLYWSVMVIFKINLLPIIQFRKL